MNKPLGEAYDVIGRVATNHHKWGNERGNNPKNISTGKYEIDGVDLIMAKLNALNQRLNKLEKDKANVVDAFNVSCDLCGFQRHASMN